MAQAPFQSFQVVVHCRTSYEEIDEIGEEKPPSTVGKWSVAYSCHLQTGRKRESKSLGSPAAIRREGRANRPDAAVGPRTTVFVAEVGVAANCAATGARAVTWTGAISGLEKTRSTVARPAGLLCLPATRREDRTGRAEPCRAARACEADQVKLLADARTP